MGKYHDQELIERVVSDIQSLSNDERIQVMNELSEGYAAAKDDYDHIDAYTAPEEVGRREQAVYYYEDVFADLNKRAHDCLSAYDAWHQQYYNRYGG